MRVPVLVVASASLVASLAACVLFVPSPEETAGSTCGLTSDERGTACGTCLASKCQSALDLCCAEGRTCESVIPAVALCEDDEEKCAAAGDGGAERVLRACASGSCADSCGDGVPAKDSGPPLEVVCENGSGLGRCFCRALTDAGSSSGTCVSRSYYRCCAEEGYPTVAGKACACLPRYCLRDRAARSCTCSYFESSSGDATSSCSAASSGVCCELEGGRECTCYDDLDRCPSGTEVSSCTESGLACLKESEDGGTAKSVARCSP